MGFSLFGWGFHDDYIGIYLGYFTFDRDVKPRIFLGFTWRRGWDGEVCTLPDVLEIDILFFKIKKEF